MFNYSIQESSILGSYCEALLSGDRSAARAIIEDSMNCGVDAFEMLTRLIWPAMEQIQHLFKEDRVTTLGMNLATRLNRSMADQVATKLERVAPHGKRVVIFCGDAEPEELGGQIAADLFEAAGWEVKFGGGGIPNDEILPLVGSYRPELLVMYATRAAGVPAVRKLIDYLRDVNSNPDMQIMCCGGIYKRAEGLAEEIGADLFAPDAADAIRIAHDNPLRRAQSTQQTVGRSRRSRKGTPVNREAA